VSTVTVDVTISGNKVTPNGDRVQAHVGEPIQQQEQGPLGSWGVPGRPPEWCVMTVAMERSAGPG
jgi:hypothetical protein